MKEENVEGLLQMYIQYELDVAEWLRPLEWVTSDTW